MDSPGKVPNDPPALSLDSDGCLEVRGGLEVVLIHLVLEVTPQRSSGLMSAVTKANPSLPATLGVHLEHIFERL